MVKRKAPVLAALVCGILVSVGGIYGGMGAAAEPAVDEGVQTSAKCARCGDGVCARSCETATSCPRDCAGVPSAR